jgi:glycosyltransferase involved in cell wall biosynthesis
VTNEVAIYATSARSAGLYDRTVARDGGAERQMALLAQALAGRGHRVAHIIFEPREPTTLTYPVMLVHREPRSATRSRIVRGLLEARAVWRALRAADAAVVVLRSASPVLAVAALYCLLRRRALIFSSSNVSDFTMERMSSRWTRLLYRLGLRLASTVVVQSENQRLLALETFPALSKVAHIPSFADAAPRRQPESRAGPDTFLWFGRTVEEKQPLRFVRLARNVPEARFTMILTDVGLNDQLHAEIQAAAKAAPNLVILEPVPHEQLSQLIATSVAVVNTSTLEGMPNSFLEAWLAGVPVLTYEFDPDGVVAARGLGVAAGGSWERFVAGARELWESRAEREQIAQRVRAHVAETHSVATVGAQWGALVEELQGDL